jgi:hypothetical protein
MKRRRRRERRESEERGRKEKKKAKEKRHGSSRVVVGIRIDGEEQLVVIRTRPSVKRGCNT